jgi:hypothetical protein
LYTELLCKVANGFPKTSSCFCFNNVTEHDQSPKNRTIGKVKSGPISSTISIPEEKCLVKRGWSQSAAERAGGNAVNDSGKALYKVRVGEEREYRGQ